MHTTTRKMLETYIIIIYAFLILSIFNRCAKCERNEHCEIHTACLRKKKEN